MFTSFHLKDGRTFIICQEVAAGQAVSLGRRDILKGIQEVNVKVEFTEGYEERFTKACLRQLELRQKRQKEPPAIGKQLDGKVIA